MKKNIEFISPVKKNEPNPIKEITHGTYNNVLRFSGQNSGSDLSTKALRISRIGF